MRSNLSTATEDQYQHHLDGVLGCLFWITRASLKLNFEYGIHSLLVELSSIILFWQVDYFVDCHYSEVDDRMWVIGGTNAGTLGYFPVNHRGVGAIGSPEAILEGGHSAVVRAVLPVSCTHVRLTQNQGIFGWTGGEDGRLCCWLSDESSEANNSWISGSLVMKSERPNRKSRHHPYWKLGFNCVFPCSYGARLFLFDVIIVFIMFGQFDLKEEKQSKENSPSWEEKDPGVK